MAEADQMTDSLTRKAYFGQEIGKGFLPDVHLPTGAPKESIVKITKAEDGGIRRQGAVAPRRARPAASRTIRGDEGVPRRGGSSAKAEES